MPFLAKSERSTTNLVIPEEVEDGQDVFCPGCGGRMRPRGGEGQRARHFFHVANIEAGELVPDSCPGAAGVGESERHRKLKSLAVSALRRRFSGDGSLEECAPEISVDVSDSRSEADERRADALVRFTERNAYFGRGVVIEVQHANEGKDIRQVTADYLAADYSVLWTDESDFADDHLPTATIDDAFDAQDGQAYTPYHYDSYDLLDIVTSELFYADLPNDWSLTDPKPGCEHEFEQRNEWNRCLLCGTPIVFAHDIGKYAYGPPDPDEGVAADPRLGVDIRGPRDAVLHRPHIHRWEAVEKDGGRRERRCSGCGASRTNPPHVIIIDYAPDKSLTDR